MKYEFLVSCLLGFRELIKFNRSKYIMHTLMSHRNPLSKLLSGDDGDRSRLITRELALETRLHTRCSEGHGHVSYLHSSL